ncbi:MAG: biopolymer transporter ExbD [Hydrogenophaga sp.]|jgi:biopolymer transport protein ExbD|uniref:ExbD/TolR family protein n=1 Tax=Hydrogenophaga sp. TaxID=1904254 RepID=UPI0027341412|nr:biopolymer transporter ExbD [Hydrogenophaga sp.]MDP2096506.1 biopolymer transporter ExbD [Hydrogenophaga sp.]MDP3346037.1 biopolymer transporter ExbD [Hydrogenophaga sp.]MDP3808678.1 biopolymer transporter ExbD [Hydrogenophaga sp.]MDP3924935.1 biopolymer transporter ExbD [Hydrogenophaga sp.]MDZ4239686.1 biopolymer transporter ExbD [Hydrogenophaga sp.]
MAIGTQEDSDAMLGEINMIPFIDVMLVLLIIFIITVPVIKHAVNIDLPRASNEKVLDKPENVRLSIDADGAYFWNEQRVEDADLNNRLRAAADQTPQPELHIRGDKAVRYERVALAMAAAQSAGVRKIGFITEPTATGQ